VDPKLVMSWVLGALGAPAAAVGWLVPVREAGALLPQLALSRHVQAGESVRWFWVVGSVGQGLAVLAMAGVILSLEGAAAGWAMVSLLALFALSRSVCSVSYRALQGVTLVKSTRGTATGLAGSLASALVFLFGVLLATGVLPLAVPTIAWVFCIAAGLWFFAAFAIHQLREDLDSPDQKRSGARHSLGQLRLLREDPQLLRFTIVRGLLAATALAPPFVVTTGLKHGLGQLGPFVLASALASVLSAYIWGRFADRSSRRVLIWSGLVATVPLLVVAVLIRARPGTLDAGWPLPCALFVLMVAYQGVRLGRATHLVDMAPPDQRAAYTAVSNSVIGVVLLVGGVFGWIADQWGREVVLAAFTIASLAAAFLARRLDEVQKA
ncbi:MAG: hypothetical protein ACJAQ3_003456, partial [Planctomycetota bacterium]